MNSINDVLVAALFIYFRTVSPKKKNQQFICFLQSLRTFEAKDAQVCLFAIQKLLTTGKFPDMVKEFSSTTPAQHWKSSRSYELHVAYHKVYSIQVKPTNNLIPYRGNIPTWIWISLFRWMANWLIFNSEEFQKSKFANI